MLQNGPDPSTTKANIFPFNLYWPVSRSSGKVKRTFIVIDTGSALFEKTGGKKTLIKSNTMYKIKTT